MHPLPPHSVRVSRRARRPSLRASVRTGLEVVVPVGFDLRRIPELFERHRAWVQRIVRRLNRDRPLLLPGHGADRPEAVELRALGERWIVEYVPAKTKSVSAREATNLPGERVLRLRGAIGSKRACRDALSRWLQRRAVKTLTTWLQEVSLDLQLPYRRVGVRAQATRWGSCSRTKDISLNRKLLLLPSHLVRYVLIHELCHTVEANHGKGFWHLLATFEPLWKPIRAELRTAWRYVPAWAE